MPEESSPRNIPEGMPVSNRDIFPSDEFVGLYPELKPILRIAQVEAFFIDTDSSAVSRKKSFVKFGTLSLIMVTLVLVLLSWRLSLALLSISFPFWLEFAGAIIGLAAICIQLYLFFTDVHQNWLYARYMSEKARLWKFQILLDGEFISDFLRLPEAFSEELNRRWVFFKEQFNHGRGGMEEFVDAQPLELMIKPKPYTDQPLLLQIKEIYLALRIDVQSTHFSDQYVRLAVMDGLTDSWAKVLLGLSGILAVVEACLLGLQAGNLIDFSEGGFKILTAVLAGVSLTFAIVSAAIRVYRSASAVAENRERYRAKQNYLKRIRYFFQDETDHEKILSLITETENVCNEELQEFIISLRRADYFF